MDKKITVEERRKLVEERLPLLYKIMEHCTLCPRKCGVNRLKGEKGFCRTTDKIKIASWAQHKGEEPPITGTNGSGAIFPSMCTFACKFCQNFPFSQLDNGVFMTPQELAEKYDYVAKKGVHNLNFVTPTHVIPMLLDAWLNAKPETQKLPLVYNCSGYESEEVLDLLDGIIDVYLPDIKYSQNKPAMQLSSCPNYVEENRRTLKQMFKQVGLLTVDPETELATKGMIIRHLILPNDLAGSKDSLIWLRNEFGPDINVSIMCQYFPAYRVHGDPVLGREITPDEYMPVLDLVEELGFNNVLAQDPTDRGGA